MAGNERAEVVLKILPRQSTKDPAIALPYSYYVAGFRSVVKPPEKTGGRR